MTYRAPVDQMKTLLEKALNYEQLVKTDAFAEANLETVSAILGEAAKMTEDVLAPLQRNGDLHPAHLENGVVRTSPGYQDGYDAISEGGWIGMSAPQEHGGMGLPLTLATCVNEMMSSACLSLSLNPLMTQGQIEALEHHASDDIKNMYLPKLISGEWTGTMNLTEPQAGSDVGALASKAVSNGDGTYSVSGHKIYISWGDHDLAANVCHLVLARLPDAPKGTKGVSLFVVPKILPNSDGTLGQANSLKVVSLEHKMGLHGSPTAVMEFDGAKGWMVGPDNGGMAAMFTMMNNARLGVGVEGLGTAEAAMQKAIAFAKDRKQGRSPVENGHGTIVDHADVRRMIMTMKALTFAARAICYDTAISLDMGRALNDTTWTARGAALTPIAKAFSTDIGSEVSDLAIQVHGGMGFIEETGAAQYARDVRVTRIYEGTNGIQAMDLVGRKLSDGGKAVQALLDEMSDSSAKTALQAATDWMLNAEPNDRFAGSTAYLRAFALTLGAHYVERLKDDEPALAAFYASYITPQISGFCVIAQAGAETLYLQEADAL